MSQTKMQTETEPIQTGNPDPIRASVEADLANAPFREPVIGDYVPEIHDAKPDEGYFSRLERIANHNKANEIKGAKIDHQWLVLTEAARRAINSNTDARSAIAGFTSRPLSEKLPLEAVTIIVDKDTRTARIAKRMSGTLGAVLELEEVPDGLIAPDITHAPYHQQREHEIESLTKQKKRDPEFYDDMLKYTKIQVEQKPGITQAERKLVARRYRYARDIKMLGLMAELHDQPLESPSAEDGVVTHELESGTRLVMTTEAYLSNPTLLDPKKWEKRTQLKDRVYTVQVDGKSYILKERKTARHTDTKENGHKDGLTSAQEFAVATQFAEMGTIKKGDINLRWEKPLGYVEFPDGYSFCLFEQEPGLDTSRPRYELAREILGSPDEYKQEFEETAQKAKVLYEERKDLLYGFDREEPSSAPKRLALSRTARRQKRAIKNQPKADELTFAEFAELKAHHLIDEARDLLSQTMWDKGINNSDIDGYGFKVVPGERPTLEIIGFDFEYYNHDPEGASWVQQNVKRHKLSGESAGMHAYRIADIRGIMVAASYSMLERSGHFLPPVSKRYLA